MTCHRCRREIAVGDRAPQRFVIRAGQARQLTTLRTHHWKCVPPHEFHKARQVYERNTPDAGRSGRDTASGHGPS